MAAAGFLKCPELALESKEATTLAEAVKGVADQYTYSVDPRTIAWGNMLMVCAMIYGPRMMAIYRKRESEQPKRAPVMPINEPRPVQTQQRANGAAQPMTPSQMYQGTDFSFGVQD